MNIEVARRTVASSLSVGSATEMRRPCRSFASTSLFSSANSLEVNVLRTNHASTSSPIAVLRAARSSGSAAGGRKSGVTGSAVRTMIAAREAPMSSWPTGPMGSFAFSRPVAPNTTPSCVAISSVMTFAGSPVRVTSRSTRSSRARSPSSW